MLKEIIKKLYKKYCTQPVQIFQPVEKNLNKKEKLRIYVECKQMIDLGVLKQIIGMEVAESEEKQLYEALNQPFQTTEAELYRNQRVGIENLWNRIQVFANKIPKPEEEFDRHSIT